MRVLWVLAAALILASVVALFLRDDNDLAMLFLIAGSAISLIDQYREKRR